MDLDATGTSCPAGPRDLGAAPCWQRLPLLPFGLAGLFVCFEALPRVHGNPRLAVMFLGIGAFLVAWTVLLWANAKRWTHCFRIERAPLLRSHYVQASVQSAIYAYWGWYWRDVYRELPLILSQLVFLYAFDALLAWTRGRPWRIGCGPLPIVLSTNVFIWFVDDVYVFQFLLVAVGALGKEFVRWNRDGKRTHVFNPSAFTLAIFSIVLIATNTTYLTRGIAIATTLALPPHIYLEIFLLGLVVQYFFAVTLMTFSAAAALILLNALYNKVTGTYYFVDTELPIAIFLGLHLLMTDPSTSPRTNLGRVIFGGLYGIANFVLYLVFQRAGIPEFYDKLLPVPVLNASVQVIDRFARSGSLGRLTAWEARFRPKRSNLVYMGAWCAVFLALLTSGSVDAPHPGASIAFWKKAYAEGKYDAGPRLLKLLGSQAEQGSASAQSDLGALYLEGKAVKADHAAAAHWFALSCQGGDLEGCANLASQFLFLREARSDEDVARALAVLERGTLARGASAGANAKACYLVGFAYETGRGRPQDVEKARRCYDEACRLGHPDACKALARTRVAGSR
jgi:hypothetical protein